MGDWMTPEERKWVKALQRLAKKQPEGLILYATGASTVVVPLQDYMDGILQPDRHEDTGLRAEGGDPDWAIKGDHE